MNETLLCAKLAHQRAANAGEDRLIIFTGWHSSHNTIFSPLEPRLSVEELNAEI